MKVDQDILEQSQSNEELQKKDCLRFENITCTQKIFSRNEFRFKNKVILNGISGCFKSGELSGIIGPSGAGKTTLLNILSGFSTTGAQGDIILNGVSVSASQSNGRGGAKYIRQQNDLRPSLNIFESMFFAAGLKLPHLSSDERYQKITVILDNLNISNVQINVVQKLSEGEKRRLAIALELISDPLLLFLDEPTSGLDSSSSTSLISLLSDLAKGGRTIITTIHQPSALILEKINTILCLANGRILYDGPQANLIPAFEYADLHCPPYYNPADFLIEIASVSNLKTINEAAGNMLEYNTNSISGKNIKRTHKVNNENICDIPKSVTTKNSAYFLYQIWLLTHRSYLILIRNYTMLLLRTTAYLMTAFLTGKVYYMSGKDASTIIGSTSAIYSSVIFISYASHMYTTLLLPLEVQFLKGEYFNCWYRLGPYITSLFILELPFQIILTTLFAIITYWQTGNLIEVERMFLYFTAMILVSLCAHSWGLFLGSITSPKVGVFLGAFVISTYSLFGFSLPLKDIPYIYRWLYHISYFRAGCHLAITAIHGFNRKKLNCSKIYCHYVDPKLFLKEYDLDSVNVASNIMLMLISAFFLYSLTFTLLYYRLNRR